MNTGDTEVMIREFTQGDQADFRRLNEEWITRYFALESKDEYALADPQRTILDGGGRIFLAVRHGEAVGCCALLAVVSGEFEVAKMAVTEFSQRAGVGRRLQEEAIHWITSCLPKIQPEGQKDAPLECRCADRIPLHLCASIRSELPPLRAQGRPHIVRGVDRQSWPYGG